MVSGSSESRWSFWLLRLPVAAAAIGGLAVWAASGLGAVAQAPQASEAAAPASNPRSEALKAQVVADVEGMRTFTQQMVDQVFSFGELGFQETETSKYLTGVLEKNGFRIERGFAGIPTAWVATWGSGKPVIALGSDIDGIPQASQKPGVGYHDPLIEGAPGHGEGHNSGVPLNITAALAVKRLMEKEKLSGTIKIWPGVAEELVGAKAYFVTRRPVQGRRRVLFSHVGNNFSTSAGAPRAAPACVSVRVHLPGRERARGRRSPWRGRSALDAVELMNIGWNFRREHLRLQQRSHYVITDGGDQPNVVPQRATVWYYFRETDYEHIKELLGDRRHDRRRARR